MHAYNMLADGDKVLVAVSGGVDSLVLAWLLQAWRNKAPIHYELLAVHLDMGFGSKELDLVKVQLDRLDLPSLLEKTDFGPKALEINDGKGGCYHCAKQRRNRLFEIAREKNYNKLALGHHKEDIIETLFLNMIYSGNLSTMVPRQDLFGGSLSIIRPLSYLNKEQVKGIGSELGIVPVINPCPLSGDTHREQVRSWLSDLYHKEPMAQSNIFAALSNVKTDYLLKPTAPSDEDNT